MEKWEDDFRRDLHALKEVAVWLTMATVYRRFAFQGDVTPPQKAEIAHLLVASTTLPIEEAVKAVGARSLSKERIQEILDYFHRVRSSEEKEVPGHFSFLPQ